MVVRSQGESQPRIAAIVSRAISSFGALVSALDGTLPESSAAASHLARFKLWAGTLSAHRVAGSRSLEYRLRDASSIRNHIISLLQDLCDALDDGTIGLMQKISVNQRTLTVDQGVLATKETAEGLSGEQDSAGAGDSTDADLEDYFRDDPQEGDSEISAILDGVGHIVDCLLRLSITIRNPAPHDHFKSRAGTDVINPYEQWDIKHVCEKFPNADPGIAKRLGKATARRRQYFKYREEHAMKLSEGLDAGDDGEREEKGERATTIASSIPDRLKESQATADFADLNDIESTVSKTSYALSTADETQLRVPPLPKEHADGPFGCPYCCMIVSINTRHEWKKHVFRDLRPYVCLSPSCTTPEQQYLRRSDWMEHMKRDHWRIWQCPFGCLDTFHSAREFEQHVSGAHPSREPSRNLDTLQRLSSQPDYPARAKGQCPLCLDFQIMSDKQYGSHVGAHLEQLALFALPSTDADGDESDDTESESSGQDGKKYDTESLDSVREGGAPPATAPAEEEPDPEFETLWARAAKFGRVEVIPRSQEEAKKKIERATIESEKPDPEALKAELVALKEYLEEQVKAGTSLAPDVKSLQMVNRRLGELMRLDNGKEVERAGIDAEKKPDPEIEAMKVQLAEYEGDNQKRAEEERLAAELEVKIQREAEEALERRMEALTIPEEIGKETERARIEAETKVDPEGVEALEAQLAKYQEEEKKRAEAEMPAELRANMQREAKEALSKRMEELLIDHEEVKKEIERARIEAETAARERIEAEKKAEEEKKKQLYEEDIKALEWEVLASESNAGEERKKRQIGETQADVQIEPGITGEQGTVYDPVKAEKEAKAAEESQQLERIEEEAKKALEEAIKEQEEKLAAAVKAERERIEAAQKAEAQAKARVEPGTTEAKQEVCDQTKAEGEGNPAEEPERYRGARTPSPPLSNESRGRRRSGAHQSRSPSSSPERPSSARDAEQAATGASAGRPMLQINRISLRFTMVLRPLCEDFINNPPSTVDELIEKRRSITEDVMQRVILPLDGVDVRGHEAARARRKEVMLHVQSVLRRMDAVELPSVNEGGG
jgi:hypothetical protein